MKCARALVRGPGRDGDAAALACGTAWNWVHHGAAYVAGTLAHTERPGIITTYVASHVRSSLVRVLPPTIPDTDG
jgi:hypothetical protein